MTKYFPPFYKYSSVFLLVITALAKLASATGNQGVLNTVDPVVGLNVRYLLVALGVVELVFAYLLLKDYRASFTCACVSALGAIFLLYHIIFGLGHFNRGCPCLGTIGQKLHFSQAHVDKAMIFFATWLFVGGMFAIFFLRQKSVKTGGLEPVGFGG